MSAREVQEMDTAYVLIKTELGSETEVMKGLKMIEEVKEAHLVYGAYDIIARVEADTRDDLKNVIHSKVRRLNNIRSTLTMVVVWDPNNYSAIRARASLLKL